MRKTSEKGRKVRHRNAGIGRCAAKLGTTQMPPGKPSSYHTSASRKRRRYPGPNVSQAVDSLSWPRRTLYVCRKTLPHSLLPRRGRNMSAQGKQPRVLRAVARPWVTGNKIPNSPERAQQSPRTGAAVPLRRAAQRGALDGVSRRWSAFVLVADDPGLRFGVYLGRHLLRPFRAKTLEAAVFTVAQLFCRRSVRSSRAGLS
jgi:hypothetical protein